MDGRLKNIRWSLRGHVTSLFSWGIPKRIHLKILFFREVSPENTPSAPKPERCSQTFLMLSTFSCREISPETRSVLLSNVSLMCYLFFSLHWFGFQVETLIMMYKTHCQCVLDNAINVNFEEVTASAAADVPTCSLFDSLSDCCCSRSRTSCCISGRECPTTSFPCWKTPSSWTSSVSVIPSSTRSAETNRSNVLVTRTWPVFVFFVCVLRF